MSKLLGFQNGMPVQAAAGTSKTLSQRLQSPSGLLLVTGLLTLGWIVGREVGQSVREGTSLMHTTPRRKVVGDGEQWLSAVATYSALGMSGEFVVGLAKQYGWDKVLGYSGSYLVVVSAIKKFVG